MLLVLIGVGIRRGMECPALNLELHWTAQEDLTDQVRHLVMALLSTLKFLDGTGAVVSQENPLQALNQVVPLMDPECQGGRNQRLVVHQTSKQLVPIGIGHGTSQEIIYHLRPRRDLSMVQDCLEVQIRYLVQKQVMKRISQGSTGVGDLLEMKQMVLCLEHRLMVQVDLEGQTHVRDKQLLERGTLLE